MKVSKLNKILAPLISVVISSTAAQAVLINGSFESPPVVAVLGYEYRNGVELTGWVEANSLRGVAQFNSGYDLVSDGLHAVQIETVGGTLSQEFATSVGVDYRITFELSAATIPFGLSYPGELRVSAASSFGDFSGIPGSYASHFLDFTATGPTSTVEFLNNGIQGISYPHIDNVSISAVGVGVPVGGSTLTMLGLALAGIFRFCRKTA